MTEGTENKPPTADQVAQWKRQEDARRAASNAKKRPQDKSSGSFDTVRPAERKIGVVRPTRFPKGKVG